MRIKNSLDNVLGSPTKVRLLRTLVGSPSRGWTGRELAAAAEVSTAQAARDLAQFLDIGIVSREVHGRSYAWRPNRGHVLTAELVHMFGFESHLSESLAKDLNRLLAHIPARRALLFGSAARGDAGDDSDVDLFVEVKSVREKTTTLSALTEARGQIWDRYGNPLSALVYTSAEVRHPPNPSLLESIEREGIVLIPKAAA
jgi:predicted nucleotidyltransferase